MNVSPEAAAREASLIASAVQALDPAGRKLSVLCLQAASRHCAMRAAQHRRDHPGAEPIPADHLKALAAHLAMAALAIVILTRDWEALNAESYASAKPPAYGLGRRQR